MTQIPWEMFKQELPDLNEQDTGYEKASCCKLCLVGKCAIKHGQAYSCRFWKPLYCLNSSSTKACASLLCLLHVRVM